MEIEKEQEQQEEVTEDGGKENEEEEAKQESEQKNKSQVDNVKEESDELEDNAEEKEEEVEEEEEKKKKRRHRKVTPLDRFYYNFLKPCEKSCEINFIDDWGKYIVSEKYKIRNKTRKLPLKVNSDEIKFLKTSYEIYYSLIFAKRIKENDKNGKKSMKYYMLKAYNKECIIKWDFVKCVKYEKSILTFTKFPFVGHLEFHYTDIDHLYLGFPFIAGLSLKYYLKQQMRLPEHIIRFYAAQIVLSYEYLHDMDVLYRNLKPTNIIIQPNGYIKLVGFMKSKYVKYRTYTQCVDIEYAAPECIDIGGTGYGYSADWWALAVNIFEMGVGHTPFDCGVYEKTCSRIMSGTYKMPVYFSYELQNFMKRMFLLELKHRLGIADNGVEDVKRHRWFNKMPWMNILNQRLKPPFVPNLKNPLIEKKFVDEDDTEFDEYFEDF